MDNSAFTERSGDELANILRELAKKVENVYDFADAFDGNLRAYDSNGNIVGGLQVFTERE